MSKPTHTPEPWRIRTDLPQPVIASESGQYVVAIPSEVNASRIVECVNAMAGIDNPSNHRATWDAIQHLELDKYQELKKVVEDVVRLIDEGRELKPDSIIVEALRHGIK